MNNLKEHITVIYIIVYLRYCQVGAFSHCTQTYQTDDGKTCIYCPPGTHLSKDCDISGQSAHCMGCELGHYQNQCNRAARCESCSPNCKHRHMVKVKECTLYQDIICECVEGKYWKKETEDDGVCLDHSMCQTGFGLLHLGNPREDTKCGQCIDGYTFSSEKSFQRCQPCIKCNKYQKACRTSADALCANSTTTGNLPESTQETRTNATTTVTLIVLICAAVLSIIIVGVACFIYRYRRKYNGSVSITAEIQNQIDRGIHDAVHRNFHFRAGNQNDTINRTSEFDHSTQNQTNPEIEFNIHLSATPFSNDNNDQSVVDPSISSSSTIDETNEIDKPPYSIRKKRIESSTSYSMLKSTDDGSSSHPSDHPFIAEETNENTAVYCGNLEYFQTKNPSEKKREEILSRHSENCVTSFNNSMLDKTNGSSVSEQTNSPFIAEETNQNAVGLAKQIDSFHKINGKDISPEKSPSNLYLYYTESEGVEPQMKELKPVNTEEVETNEMNVITEQITSIDYDDNQEGV